jgi:hypothetical protein
MSHVASIDIAINDLTALKAAVKELGCEWREGQLNYKWYGTSVGDYPLPKGMTVEMLGKCSHAIKVPGVNYEIGVVKMPDGTFTLAYDFYGYDGGTHDGHKLLAKFGEKLGKLVQGYAVHRATLEAQRKGLRVIRTTTANGSIRLAITGARL